MAIITLPPVQIDPVLYSRLPAEDISANGWRGIKGIFPDGDTLYLVLTADRSPAPIGMFKSEDAGFTWERLDAADQPPDSNAKRSCYSARGSGSTTIQVGYVTAQPPPAGANNVKMKVFPQPTEEWGSEVNSGVDLPSTAVGQGPVGIAFSTDAYYLFHTLRTAPGLYYLQFSGGSWGARTLILAVNSLTSIYAGVIDSLNRTHLVYMDLSSFFPFTGNLKYVQVSSSLVAGTPQTLIASPSFDMSAGNAVIWGDRVVFPYMDVATATIPFVQIGTPLGSPVFTIEQVDAGAVAPRDSPAYIQAVLNRDGDLVVFWSAYDPNAPIDQLWMNTRTASGWGTPVLFYDAVANPPANGEAYPLQFIHTIDAYQLSDDRWVVIIALETDDAGGSHCTGFALVQDAPPPVECPDIFVERQAQPDAPEPADPPAACEPFTPTTPAPVVTSYAEPVELQGS